MAYCGKGPVSGVAVWRWEPVLGLEAMVTTAHLLGLPSVDPRLRSPRSRVLVLDVAMAQLVGSHLVPHVGFLYWGMMRDWLLLIWGAPQICINRKVPVARCDACLLDYCIFTTYRWLHIGERWIGQSEPILSF